MTIHLPIPEDQEALLRAIVARPDDDGTRLVYADWLEEHGDAEQSAFVRSSLELHALSLDNPQRAALAAELLKQSEARGAEWLKAVGVNSANEITLKFVRGCVEGVELQSLRPFFDAAEALFRLFPIREFTFWWQYSWGLNDKTLPRLAEMPELGRLQVLRLANYGTSCPTRAWRTFFRSPHLSGLQYLGIHACECSDADAEALADAPPLAGLTGLSLTDNQIGPAGTRALLRSPYLSGLTRLGLAGNLDDECQALLEELTSRFPGQCPLEPASRRNKPAAWPLASPRGPGIECRRLRRCSPSARHRGDAHSQQLWGEPMSPSATALSLAWQHEDAGNLGEAEALYRQVLAADPQEVNALYHLGVLCLVQGRATEAIDLCEQCLKIKPDFAEVQNNLGVAYAALGRLPEALACYQQTVRLAPDYADAFRNLGNALVAQGQFAEAADCYRSVLRVRPDDASAANNLGSAYLALQQWEEAVACWQRSLAYDASNPFTYRNLANVFYHLGKYGEALACYQRVLALCPEDTAARLAVEALCGTSQLARVPADYLTDQYDALAAHFDRDVVQRFGYRSPELLLAALGPAPAPRSLAVLDLGCGTGLCGLQFRDWASTLVGVDLSSQMLAQARERGVYDELIHGDLLGALQRGEGKYDLVLASDVLLYLGDLRPVTQAVQQALRPGGRFAFTIDVLEGTDYHLQAVGHFAHSHAYLQRVASEAQLREVCASPVVFPREGGPGAPGLVVVWSRPL
jgi:uncharacterized protein (TIGR02996 family)